MTVTSHSHCATCYRSYNCSQRLAEGITCHIINCELLCGARFHACKSSEHKLLCPNEKVPCINAVNGCPFVLQRSKRGSHLETCPASVIFCTMEWNRWPLYTEERLKSVPFRHTNPNIREGQLDVALAFRDQRVLNAAMKVSSRTRKALATPLTRRFPAMPLSHVRAVSIESDSTGESMPTSKTVSDDEYETPWGLHSVPPGLSSSVCKRLLKSSKVAEQDNLENCMAVGISSKSERPLMVLDLERLATTGEYHMTCNDQSNDGMNDYVNGKNEERCEKEEVSCSNGLGMRCHDIITHVSEMIDGIYELRDSSNEANMVNTDSRLSEAEEAATSLITDPVKHARIVNGNYFHESIDPITGLQVSHPQIIDPNTGLDMESAAIQKLREPCFKASMIVKEELQQELIEINEGLRQELKKYDEQHDQRFANCVSQTYSKKCDISSNEKETVDKIHEISKAEVQEATAKISENSNEELCINNLNFTLSQNKTKTEHQKNEKAFSPDCSANAFNGWAVPITADKLAECCEKGLALCASEKSSNTGQGIGFSNGFDSDKALQFCDRKGSKGVSVKNTGQNKQISSLSVDKRSSESIDQGVGNSNAFAVRAFLENASEDPDIARLSSESAVGASPSFGFDISSKDDSFTANSENPTEEEAGEEMSDTCLDCRALQHVVLVGSGKDTEVSESSTVNEKQSLSDKAVSLPRDSVSVTRDQLMYNLRAKSAPPDIHPIPEEYLSEEGIFIPPPPPPPPPTPMLRNESLGLDLTIEFVTRYQPKPRAMYTFLCSQAFRRDQYPWHYRNIHGDIHSALNGWLEQRCPLSSQGCMHSVRRLYPNHKGAEVIYDEAIECFGWKPVVTPELLDGSGVSGLHCAANAYSKSSVEDDTLEEQNYDLSSDDKFSHLPFELICHVARLLDSFSLSNLALVSRLMRDVSSSLLEEKGIVILEWEKRQYPSRSTWQIAYKRWFFSNSFTPISRWGFNDTPHLADHMQSCPFNKRIVNTEPFSYNVNNEYISMLENVGEKLAYLQARGIVKMGRIW